MPAAARAASDGGCAGPGDPAADPPVTQASSSMDRGLRLTGRRCRGGPPMAGATVTRDSAARASLSAAAFGASGSAAAASVSRLISGPMPSVHSPLRTYDSALCSLRRRFACLPNRADY